MREAGYVARESRHERHRPAVARQRQKSLESGRRHVLGARHDDLDLSQAALGSGCPLVRRPSRMRRGVPRAARGGTGKKGARGVLRPRTQRPSNLGLFPTPTGFHSAVPDPVLDEAVLPVFHGGAWLFSWFRVFQRGSIQTYLLYIFLTLLALLLWRS